MDISLSPEQRAIEASVAKLCAGFGDDYWTQCDQEPRFPHEFHRAFAEAGSWASPCRSSSAARGWASSRRRS